MKALEISWCQVFVGTADELQKYKSFNDLWPVSVFRHFLISDISADKSRLSAASAETIHFKMDKIIFKFMFGLSTNKIKIITYAKSDLFIQYLFYTFIVP